MTSDGIDAMPAVSTRTIQLEKIRVRLDTAMSEYMIDAKADIIEDHLTREFRVGLSGFLLGEKIESKTIQYPDGWWEAFKLEALPLWLKKFFAPVKYCRRTITVKAVYPDFKPALPKERYIVVLNEE